jgi:DNA-binding transcriptional ArsR family regulator
VHLPDHLSPLPRGDTGRVDRRALAHPPATTSTRATPPLCSPPPGAARGDDLLDPLIHAPARLRIVVTLAALREGDSLSFARLQRMLELTPGNLITHLRKLEDAGYLVTDKSRARSSAGTSVTLTRAGRTAFDAYTASLRAILDGA